MENFLIFFICITIIISIIFFTIYQNSLYIKDKYTEDDNKYYNIFTVKNVNDLRKHFVIDNPYEDGVDPTDGMVDYTYAMPRDDYGIVKPNVNNDRSWSEIPSEGNINEILFDYDDGFILGLSKELQYNDLYPSIFENSCRVKDKAGTSRLSSRKLFKGGLFIFDVEHIPIGCGIWPAIWLNGFVGLPDQYHEKEGTPKFMEGIKKLYDSTVLCGKKEYSLDPNQAMDRFMRKYLKKEVYQAQWPVGGEFDIVEQTNFSKTNLMSIHGGPNCEVKSEDKDTQYTYPWISDLHEKLELRSVCGQTIDRFDPGYGLYSGCKKDEYKIFKNERSCPELSGLNSGNSQITCPFGSFGEPFNKTNGGVYAVQWIPNKKVYMWFYPRTDFSKEELSKSQMPLSMNPTPDKWSSMEKNKKVLLMSYSLDDPNALTTGCDFNYQSIIMNITVGGGWGAAVVPDYCTFDSNNCNINIKKGGGGGSGGGSGGGGSGPTGVFGNYKQKYTNNYEEGPKGCITENYEPNYNYRAGGPAYYSDYVQSCYTADPSKTDQDGFGVNGCYDGSFNKDARGDDATPVFFKEAYFKIRSINVFQRKEGNKNSDDKNVW
jgi:hypothetical protein